MQMPPFLERCEILDGADMEKSGKVIRRKNGEYYKIKLCGRVCYLPLFEVAPGVKIAIFNLLGETTLLERIGKELANKMPKIDVIVTPEVKSVPLAYEVAKQLKVPYVVLRKIVKPYMAGAIKSTVVTITTGKPQDLWLDGKDIIILKNKRVALVDDVISTGATLRGMRKLVKKANGKIVVECAVFTEGDSRKWRKIVSLGNLPVFLNNGGERLK